MENPGAQYHPISLHSGIDLHHGASGSPNGTQGRARAQVKRMEPPARPFDIRSCTLSGFSGLGLKVWGSRAHDFRVEVIGDRIYRFYVSNSPEQEELGPPEVPCMSSHDETKHPKVALDTK